MAAKKSAGKNGQVMDVKKPKIMAGSGPVQDASNDGGDEAATAPILTPAKKVVIKPIHDDLVPDDPKPEAKTEVEDKISDESEAKVEETVNETETQPEADTAPPVEAETKPPEAEKAEVKPEDTDSTKPGAAERATAEAAKAEVKVDEIEPESDDAAEEARKEHNDYVSKLVVSQEYFLPIKTVNQRAARRALMIGIPLILILVAFWYNLAIDANLLPNTFNLPHTDFFSSNN